MALLSDIITEVRIEINDEDKTRFPSDTTILSIVKRAIRRANRIAQRHALQFAKKSIEITTIAGQDYLTLSSAAPNLDVVIGLWYPNAHREVHFCTEREWGKIISAPPLVHALLDYGNDRIVFKGTPDSAETLTFFYYPVVDPSAYTVGSSTPWDGRLDDIIVDYAANRLKNLDEMDFSFDIKLQADMETQITQAYVPNSPTMSEGDGWV